MELRPCTRCGVLLELSVSQLYTLKKTGKRYCKECRSAISSETMKRTKSLQTKEERTRDAKIGRSSVSKEAASQAVRKQWQTIKSDPELFKKVCHDRIARSKKVWDDLSEEEKCKRVLILTSSNGKVRSDVSEKMKLLMIEKGLTSFTSEEVFHGFVPDEIDHEHKIIVEFYGDLYHCNPKKYKKENQYIKAIQRTVGEQWSRDRRRLACFYKHGYTVIIIWEKDFRLNPEKEIERIKNEVDRKRGA